MKEGNVSALKFLMPVILFGDSILELVQVKGLNFSVGKELNFERLIEFSRAATRWAGAYLNIFLWLHKQAYQMLSKLIIRILILWNFEFLRPKNQTSFTQIYIFSNSTMPPHFNYQR